MTCRFFIFVVFAALVSSGCTSVSYQSNSTDHLSWPDYYPIPVYTEDQQIPRPCRIIGTVSINAGKFTMFGGTPENEIKNVIQLAHEKGADAIKVTGMDKPDFANPNFRMNADLLRYADTWETVVLSKAQFAQYLGSRAQTLDPIEGIWISGGLNPDSIGILRDQSKPGRDFIAFILNSQNPVWRSGLKKMDIRRGLEPGSYVLTYYLDDFARRDASIILKQRNSFAFMLETAGENGTLITYKKF
jgi:hypothetical protein